MAYTAPTVTRLISLYDWFADAVRENSAYFNDLNQLEQDPFISQPRTTAAATFAYRSLFKMIESFEKTLADIDKLPAGALRTAGESAWDTAVTEFQSDVDTHLSGAGVSSITESEPYEADEALADGDAVSIFEDGAGVFKARKAISGDLKYGFVKAAFAAAAMATVYFAGENDAITSTETFINLGPQSTWKWVPSVANPGTWVKMGSGASDPADPDFVGSFEMNYVTATNGYKSFGGNADTNIYGMTLLSDRYVSRLQWVLISAGISPLGKSDANNDSGDGCWQDHSGEYWWEVTGGDGSAYAPAFTGEPYYSAKKYPGGVTVNGLTTPSAGFYSTKEFGFIIDVTCPQNLVVGDTVVLRIGNAGVPSTYVRGDRLTLGIVAAQDLTFFGGNDGDNVQTWLVTDSVAGPLAPYLLDTDVPVAYNDSGVEFLITQGAIDYVKGDKFSFAVEGGHFRWRKTVAGVVGAWSADIEIDIVPILLDSGLSATFVMGTAPAFFDGDIYEFTALQPYALSNVIKPDFDMWQWGTTSPAVAEFDLGSDKTIEAIGIAFHTIPEGATILVEGGVAPAVYTWSEPVAWAPEIIGKLLAAAQTARYIRLTLTDAQEGGIGWFYVGEALAFSHSARVQLNREYKVDRSEGVNPSSKFKGRSVGSQIQWPEGHLKEEDYAPLLEMLDFLKENDDEAFMFFPQSTRQTEVVLGTVESDDIVFNDVYSFQPDEGNARRLSCTIPLKGVAFR